MRPWTPAPRASPLRAPDHPRAALLEVADPGAENTAPYPPMPTAPGSFRGRPAHGAEPETPHALDPEPQDRPSTPR